MRTLSWWWRRETHLTAREMKKLSEIVMRTGVKKQIRKRRRK